jgi:hypothetical protein
VLNLGAYTITDYDKVTKNDGTINTTTSTPGVLTALVGIAGDGTVSWNGTNAEAGKAEVTLGDTLDLATQDLVIVEFATLDLGTNTITDYSKVTNGGTITTAATTGAALNAILAGVTGKITANYSGSITVVADTVLKGGTTLTLASGTTLTVPEEVTLTIGDTNAATLTLTNDTSQLVLEAGGKVSAAHAGSTIIKAGGSETGVTVTVTGTHSGLATVVSDEETPPTWTVSDDETGSTGTIILGGITLDLTGTAAITDEPCETSDDPPAAIGSLTAGADTTITFAGASGG